MENNNFIGLIRSSLTNLDKLHYVKEKLDTCQNKINQNNRQVKEILISSNLPQLEVADQLLEMNANSIKSISVLQKKLKTIYYEMHGQKYFNEMKHKIFKQAMSKLKELKETVKIEQHLKSEQFKSINQLLKF